jgi:hypothetical protein
MIAASLAIRASGARSTDEVPSDHGFLNSSLTSNTPAGPCSAYGVRTNLGSRRTSPRSTRLLAILRFALTT